MRDQNNSNDNDNDNMTLDVEPDKATTSRWYQSSEVNRCGVMVTPSRIRYIVIVIAVARLLVAASYCFCDSMCVMFVFATSH